MIDALLLVTKSSAMRILHVIQTMDPAGGGPPAVVSGLAAAQVNSGHEVRVAHEGSLSSAPSLSQSYSVVSLMGARRRATYQQVLSDFSPDFVHLHGVWCGVLRGFSSAARRAQIPYCVATHGALGSWSLSQKPIKKFFALHLGYSKMLSRASFLVANNTVELDEVRVGGFNTQVQLVPNGIAHTQLEEVAPAIFRERFQLGDSPLILFLGRLRYEKGPDLLIDAFSKVAEQLPAHHLVLVGPDGGMEDDLRRQMKRFPGNVNNRIKFCGPVYGRDKNSAYRAARVLCVPSRYESFGIVIVEALAMGTPIVASESCHFPLVQEEGLGLFTAQDAPHLGQALVKVLKSDEYASKAATRGPGLVREQFTWEKIAHQYDELYRRHVGSL